MDELLIEHISILVKDGFVCGFYPDWKIEYMGISSVEIDDYSLERIAFLISQGFIQGEILHTEKSGWWKLSAS